MFISFHNDNKVQYNRGLNPINEIDSSFVLPSECKVSLLWMLLLFLHTPLLMRIILNICKIYVHTCKFYNIVCILVVAPQAFEILFVRGKDGHKRPKTITFPMWSFPKIDNTEKFYGIKLLVEKFWHCKFGTINRSIKMNEGVLFTFLPFQIDQTFRGPKLSFLENNNPFISLLEILNDT